LHDASNLFYVLFELFNLDHADKD